MIDVMVRELNLKFKLAIQQKGGVGIRALRRIFNKMDFNGNKKLDASEFEQALAAFGIFPKKVELQALMKLYDIDGDGVLGVLSAALPDGLNHAVDATRAGITSATASYDGGRLQRRCRRRHRRVLRARGRAQQARER